MAITMDEKMRYKAQPMRVELAKVVPIQDGIKACDMGLRWLRENGWTS
jgi:hypothetical protein